MRYPILLGALTLVCLLSWQAVAAQAPPIELEVTADRDRVTVGDRIQVAATVRFPRDVTVEAPRPPAFGDLEVLEARPPEERDLGGGRRELVFRYVVAAFRTGPLAIPPLTVTYRDAAGVQGSVTSTGLPLTVESVIPAGEEPADIRDLKPQLSIPGGAPGWVPLALAAAAAVGAAVIVFLARRWGARRLRPRRAGPAASPEEATGRELDRLAAQDLLARGDYSTHYRALAACLRRYVSNRYRFPAFALTTGEVEGQMVGKGVGRWQARLITNLLEECDRVQYGQYRPAAARAEADLTGAYEVLSLAAGGQEGVSS